MPKVKSKGAAKRMRVLEDDLAEHAETQARTAAVAAVVDEELFAVDTGKKSAGAAGGGAGAPGSKVKLFVREAKPAKPTSLMESRKVERLSELKAAGEGRFAPRPAPSGPAAAASGLATASAQLRDVWQERRDREAAVAAARAADELTPLVEARVGSKRRRPALAPDTTVAATAAFERAAAAKASAALAGAAAEPAEASAASAAVVPADEFAEVPVVKGKRKGGRKPAPYTGVPASAAASKAAPVAAASRTLAGAVEAGMSYNPTLADHETAVLKIAHVELAAAAAKQTAKQLAEAEASGELAGVSLVKPSRQAILEARRPMVVPLREQLTGVLRTAPRAAPGTVLRDHFVGLTTAGVVPVKVRKAQRKSAVSSRRVKAVEFPRTPAAEFGKVKGHDDGDW